MKSIQFLCDVKVRNISVECLYGSGKRNGIVKIFDLHFLCSAVSNGSLCTEHVSAEFLKKTFNFLFRQYHVKDFNVSLSYAEINS